MDTCQFHGRVRVVLLGTRPLPPSHRSLVRTTHIILFSLRVKKLKLSHDLLYQGLVWHQREELITCPDPSPFDLISPRLASPGLTLYLRPRWRKNSMKKNWSNKQEIGFIFDLAGGISSRESTWRLGLHLVRRY